MHNKLNSKRINGAALELIMRDVLDGMFDFTNQACCGCKTAKMEIIAVEKDAGNSVPTSAGTVIPFRGRTAGKKTPSR